VTSELYQKENTTRNFILNSDMPFTPYKPKSGFTPYAGATTTEEPEAPQEEGGLFSSLAREAKSLARGVAKPFLKTAGTAQAALEATGQLLTGQGEKASETISRGSERMRATEKALGYEEGEIATPAMIASKVKVQDGKMTGGEFGRETLKTAGVGAEMAGYFMGAPALGTAAKTGFAAKGALGKLALQTASRESLAGAVSGAGMAAQGEDAGGWDIAGGAVLGGALGFAGGAAAPYASKYAGKAVQGLKGTKSWLTLSDEAVAKAMQAENKVDVSTPYINRKPPKTGEVPKLTQPLHEIDDDLFPPPAQDAKPISDQMRKKAEKNGFLVGRINTIGDMSQADRREALKMMDMAETRELHEFADHPMRVAAQPVADQVGHLQKVRSESGKALDPLMDAMPQKPVPIAKANESLGNWLDKRGIRVVESEKGPSLDFSGSVFSEADAGSDRGVIESVFKQIYSKQNATPKEIRLMRQRMLRTQESNKGPISVFSKDTSVLLGEIRRELLQPLTGLSEDFANANRNYAISSDKLESLYKLLGKDFIDMPDEDVMNRIEEIMPRLLSRTGAKPGAILRELADGAVATGLDPALVKDPRNLVKMAEMMNDLYDINLENAFQGRITRAIDKATEGAQVAGMLGRRDIVGLGEYAVKKMSGDQRLKQRQILRDLLSEGLQTGESKLASIAPEAKALGEGMVEEVPKAQAVAEPLENADRLKVTAEDILPIIKERGRASFPGLTKKGVAKQTAAYDRIENPEILQDILDKHAIMKESRGGKLVNPDDFRPLAHDEGLHGAYQGTQAQTVHEPVSSIGNAIKAVKIKKTKSGDMVVFTSGAPGHGKSTAIESVNPDAFNEMAWGYDSVLGNKEKSVADVNAILKNGGEVYIPYVFRDIVKAWKQGVMGRAISKGRTVPIDVYLDGAEKSWSNIQHLYDTFEGTPGVTFDLIDNRAKEKIKAVGMDKVKAMDFTDLKAKHRQELVDEVERAFKAGEIPPEVRDGLLGK
jgi:hypothetical protein